MQSSIENRRHSRRFGHNGTFELRLTGQYENSKIIAADVDESDSGMCVFTLDKLKKDDVVDVQKNLTLERKRAKVVWISEYSQDLFKVGLMFLLEDSGRSAVTA